MTSNNATSVLAEEDSAVRAVFGEVSRAWADGDADAFARWYTENATAVLPGFYLQDNNAVRTSMGVAFAGPLKGSRRIHDVRSIRFLSDSMAIVISNSATVFPGEAEAPAERREWATWVLAKQDGRWLIEAYHGSPEHAAS
jgi:uncharacterized protein (TIGR02246 family)